MIETFWPYVLVGFWAFLAATILPLSSEVVLLAELKAGLGIPWLLVAIATFGNVGGSLLNWWLGTALRRFEQQRWFPFKSAQIESATARFNRYGVWVLLLSWVPIVGDPLTLVAGVLRVPLRVFLPLVTIGKAARYAVVAAAA